jgi:D-glycero-D-manno-heptose 1,7-bisphosphate phosphatase
LIRAKAAVTGRRAVFLDRDGTINVEKDYLYRPEEFAFIPGAPQAIRRLRDAGYLVVVVTNQAGVARGYYGETEVAALHEHLRRQLAAAGTGVDAIYYCPHHPTAGAGPYQVACDCRKGAPGMLLQAASEHHIDLDRSFLVGDKLADIEAAVRAGCRPILVRTGYGSRDEPRVAAQYPGTRVCQDLPAAVALILAETSAHS